jgi:aryl-alcohol dehydrogenase-like predicted oxidoreductase
MEQPQYNMFARELFEQEYAPLYRDLGHGATVFSPLAAGLLTGKYNDGVPEGSRLALGEYGWLKDMIITPERIEKARQLAPVADELGCSMAQLGLAWCLKNPDVSSLITGASRPEQITENLKALEVVPKLAPDVLGRIDGILLGDAPPTTK